MSQWRFGGGNAVTTGGGLEGCPHHESVEIWVVAMQSPLEGV